MAVTKAKSKYVRVSPTKARLAIDLIRGMPVMDALLQLAHSNLKAGRLIKKTLVSAIANAENNHEAKREQLYVSEAKVDQGPFYKRSWSRSKGRRSIIKRKTSHFTIALDVVANRKRGK